MSFTVGCGPELEKLISLSERALRTASPPSEIPPLMVAVLVNRPAHTTIGSQPGLDRCTSNRESELMAIGSSIDVLC